MSEATTSAADATTERRRFRRRHAEPVDQTAAAAEAAPDPDEQLPNATDRLRETVLSERTARADQAAFDTADGEMAAAAFMLIATPDQVRAIRFWRDTSGTEPPFPYSEKRWMRWHLHRSSVWDPMYPGELTGGARAVFIRCVLAALRRAEADV